MSEMHDVTFNIELDLSQTVSQIRQYEMLLYRSLALAQRLGLPENIQQQIAEIQRLTMTIRLCHTALILLESASGPVGWALALVAAGGAAVSVVDYFDASRGK
jgi:hypothetical protein